MRNYSPRACWTVLAFALIGHLVQLPMANLQYTIATDHASAMPWENDCDFQTATMNNNTPHLMAAFQGELPASVGHEIHNITLAAQMLTGKIVPSGETFSLNHTVGPYDEARGFLPGPNYVAGRVILDVGGGVCMIASMLYNLTVLSNLPIIQRKPHTMVVPYVPPGQDATVSWTAGVDYRFRNNTPGPILIWTARVGNTLHMAFYGSQQAPRVIWYHEILAHSPANTIRRVNHELPEHEERLVSPGFDGYRVRSWTEVLFPDGRKIDRHLGISEYMTSPRIIEYGPSR